MDFQKQSPIFYNGWLISHNKLEISSNIIEISQNEMNTSPNEQGTSANHALSRSCRPRSNSFVQIFELLESIQFMANRVAMLEAELERARPDGSESKQPRSADRNTPGRRSAVLFFASSMGLTGTSSGGLEWTDVCLKRFFRFLQCPFGNPREKRSYQDSQRTSLLADLHGSWGQIPRDSRCKVYQKA